MTTKEYYQKLLDLLYESTFVNIDLNLKYPIEMLVYHLERILGVSHGNK